ncbi:MAG: TonB-dependent receptor [Gallionella sp.]|nr:TonB-dependent receptor [Gallionella sp.]
MNLSIARMVIPRVVVAVLAVAWAVVTLAAPVSEEDELALVYGDKPTVSIATGSSQTLRSAPSVASVITAEDIAAMGATELDQALETVPGLHVSNIGSRFLSTYQFRGINGNPLNPQVLMLQNGIPITTLYRGDKGQDWGGLPLENVARIEIIRGPGSALYGADAFSGVINIITKTAADTQGTAFGARVGSFNSKEAWLQHGGKWGAVDVAAYLSVGSTGGSKGIVTADAQTLRDTAFATHASLAPGLVSTGYDAINASVDLGYDKWRLYAGYKLQDHLGNGTGVSSALDPVGKNRGERFNTDLSWNDPRYAQNWGLGFAVNFFHYAEQEYLQLSPPGSQFATGVFPNGMIGSPSRSERQARGAGYATYSGFTSHSLRFGLGHDDLNMYKTATTKNYLLNAAGSPVPSALMDYYSIQPHILPQQRKVDYLYAQDEWNFARDWTLTAGVRHDRYSDFGGATNPRLALVWDATLDLTAKLLYGQAFRAPVFGEQYGINPVANGNPTLKPETIKTLETAFSWQARKDTQLNLSLFRYAMKNVIRAVANAAAGTGSTYQNTGGQHGSGMELEAAWDASRSVRLTGNYSYQRSIDEATNTDVGYAPHNHVYAKADWRFADNWLFSPQVNWVANRKRASGDARPQIADYTTMDLTVRTTRVKNQWDFAASVRNLFNADVREPSVAPGTALPNDLPMAPRSLSLQATYKL